MWLDRVIGALHIYWRASRGQTVEVQVVALDGHACVFLVAPMDDAEWRLPRAVLVPGLLAAQAAERALADAGLDAPVDGLVLVGLYAGGPRCEADQVALYLARSVAILGAAGSPSKGRFFAADALPAAASRDSRRHIAEALAGEACATTQR